MKITMISDVANLGKNEAFSPGDQVNWREKNARPLVIARMAVEGWIDITESAARLAKKEGVDITTVQGSGADGRIVKSDIEALVEPTEEEPEPEPDPEESPDEETFGPEEES